MQRGKSGEEERGGEEGEEEGRRGERKIGEGTKVNMSIVYRRWGLDADGSRWCEYIEDSDGHIRCLGCVPWNTEKRIQKPQFYVKVEWIKLWCFEEVR